MLRSFGLFLLFGFLFLSPAYIFSQEICDNAIDDDGDGLIDVNDRDCDCPVVEPVSLIPNPSFEEQNCCPSSRSQMNCADDWIQASEATTDYVHTCGWKGWEDLPVPLPIPDGDACIGFRDGRFGNRTNTNWKEYAGACLTSPLKAGVEYKFQFYTGFTHANNSPGIHVTFFGATSCDELPFGGGDDTFGCPTNGPGWKRLGSTYVSGVNSWVETNIDVVPTEDIYAIAIGPPCQSTSAVVNTYYFFDDLVLADQASFDFDIKLTGHPCDDDITLYVPTQDSLDYQWYKDGIALLGETDAEMTHLYGDGLYQVRVASPNIECRISKGFFYELPQLESEETIQICEGDAFFFNGNDRTVSGTYLDTIPTVDGCDSIISLNLNVFQNSGDTVYAKIYPSEFYEVGRARFYNPGVYTVDLQTEQGCDSTVLLHLAHYNLYIPNAFTPNGDGINDYYSIGGGEELISIRTFRVFNRWGNLMYESTELSPNDFGVGWNGWSRGSPAQEGVYVFMANVVYNDGIERVATGTFTLFR